MTTAVRHRPPRVFAVILLLIAAGFLYGGIQLVAVGGSFYYVLAGIALACSGVLLWRGNKLGSRIYGALLLATLPWGLFEVGADLWALAPRLVFLAVIGAWLLTPWTRRGLYSPQAAPPLLGSKLSKVMTAAVVLVVIVVVGLGAYNPVQELSPRHSSAIASAPVTSAEWRHYGNTTHGTRYVQADQITPDNAGQLEEIWRFRTGRSGTFKATPLQVGEMLYFCTAMNVVIALDAESGEKRWEFDPKMTIEPVGFATTCRGLWAREWD